MASSTSGAKASSFSFRPAAAVPQARAVASPGQKDAHLRRRSSSKSAVMMDSAVLSCPWPRTLEYSSAAPAQGQGIIAGLKQVGSQQYRFNGCILLLIWSLGVSVLHILQLSGYLPFQCMGRHLVMQRLSQPKPPGNRFFTCTIHVGLNV